MLSEVTQWGGQITTAVSPSVCPEIWNVLSYNLPPEHWRIAFKDNVIASCHATKDSNDNLVYQRLFSTVWKATTKDLPETTSVPFESGNCFGLFLL